MLTIRSYSLPLMLAVGFVLPACSSSPKEADFTPPPGNARQALEAALNRWQAGDPAGTVTVKGQPKIDVFDPRWRAGQKLVGFEVLREEPGPKDGPRTYTVLLMIDQTAPQEVRYMVIGIDPLLVYSEEEYKRLSGAGS